MKTLLSIVAGVLLTIGLHCLMFLFGYSPTILESVLVGVCCGLGSNVVVALIDGE